MLSGASRELALRPPRPEKLKMLIWLGAAVSLSWPRVHRQKRYTSKYKQNFSFSKLRRSSAQFFKTMSPSFLNVALIFSVNLVITLLLMCALKSVLVGPTESCTALTCRLAPTPPLVQPLSLFSFSESSKVGFLK